MAEVPTYPAATTGKSLILYAVQGGASGTSASVLTGGANGVAYLDANGALDATEFPALTGDVSSVAGAVATILAASGVTAGSYGSDAAVAAITIDTKGRVTAASAVAISPAAIGAIPATVEGVASGVATLDTGAHLVAAQFPALTGDLTTVAGALATTLAASGVTAGTYGSGSQIPVITTDAKGRITGVTLAAASSGFANPMTTIYDLIVGGTAGAATRLGAPTAAGTYALQFIPGTGFTYVTFPAGGGTVTSVGLVLPADFTISGSPVTASGTLTAVRAAQNANVVLAGPGSGVAAAPAYRSLVAADVPTLTGAQMPAFTGDATSTSGTDVLTLAASGVTAATYGSASESAQITVDAKGRVTAASNVAIAGALPPFSTLTDQTLNRAIGTLYTNSGSTTMAVVATLGTSITSTTATLTVNGITLSSTIQLAGSSKNTLVTFFVPPGTTYEISGTSVTFDNWIEYT